MTSLAQPRTRRCTIENPSQAGPSQAGPSQAGPSQAGNAVQSERTDLPAAPTAPVNLVQAISQTPIKPSSSRATAGKARSSKSQSQSHRANPADPSASKAATLETAAPGPVKQPDMDVHIESELSGAIFHSPGFVRKFLSGDQAKLEWIVQQCRRSEAWGKGRDRKRWKLFASSAPETERYEDLCRILNTIKRCVDAVKDLSQADLDNGTQSDVSLDYGDDPKHTDFQDGSRETIPSDEADTEGLKPDIVQFSHDFKHWETVRIPIEVKLRSSHHKAGMKQVARYARAMFAHQLDRRHVYTVMICGDEATFVLFDRAGILYSSRINLRTNSDGFTRAFASLLMLDRLGEGYDPAFETEIVPADLKSGTRRKLKYFIHLPDSAFAVAHPNTRSRSAATKSTTRRFEVVEKLCHRKSIRGRATIVLRVRVPPDSGDDGHNGNSEGGVRTRSESKAIAEAKAKAEAEAKAKAKAKAKGKGKRKRDSDKMGRPEPTGVDFVLKIIWCDPTWESEGEVMEGEMHGRFGLAQHVWHSDVMGRCRCSPLSQGQCRAGICVDETVQVDDLRVCDNLRDIKISVPGHAADGNLEEIDTTQSYPVMHRRARRVYSYILMSSIGIPLGAAPDPPTFMKAILDAILGYWQLVNSGILHRDVSYGNVMMLGEEQHFDRKRWEEKYTPEATNKILVESEMTLRKVLDELDRHPSGMLSDFDLHARYSLGQDDWGPGSKRRKTGPSTSVPIQSGYTNTSANRHRDDGPSATPDHVSQAEEARLIDFRTGTPAFMSVRVLLVRVGQKYSHNFLDDLESFFWVILWSAAAHLDGTTGSQPTRAAQEALNFMDQTSMEGLRTWKYAVLNECSDLSGQEMKNMLAEFGNTWASHPVFVNTLVSLGDYFSRIYRNGGVPSADSLPLVFSEIVDIIRSVLPATSGT